jgi:hypothetical protein
VNGIARWTRRGQIAGCSHQRVRAPMWRLRSPASVRGSRRTASRSNQLHATASSLPYALPPPMQDNQACFGQVAPARGIRRNRIDKTFRKSDCTIGHGPAHTPHAALSRRNAEGERFASDVAVSRAEGWVPFGLIAGYPGFVSTYCPHFRGSYR